MTYNVFSGTLNPTQSINFTSRIIHKPILRTVLFLLWGSIFGFSPHVDVTFCRWELNLVWSSPSPLSKILHRCKVGCGTPKTLNSTKFGNINASWERIPLWFFTKLSLFVGSSIISPCLKLVGFAQGILELWCLTLGCISPRFSCLLAVILCIRSEKVFEVQKWHQPLSPCQVWWGLDFTHYLPVAQPTASKHWRQQFGKDTHICHFGREACRIYPWLVRGWRSPKIKNFCVLLAGRPDFAVTWQCLRFLVYSHKFVIMQNTIVVFSNKFELWIFRLVQKVTFGALDVFCTLLCTTGHHSSQSELRCWSCKPSWIQLMRSSFLILKTSMFLMS